MRGTSADRPSRDITDSRNSSTIDDDDSGIPVNWSGELCCNMVKGFNFEMMVMAPHRGSRINGNHTISRTPRYQNQQLPSLIFLSYFERWRPLFPYLKSALESSKKVLTPEVLLIESELALTNVLSPSISSSNIELKLDLNFPVARESLICRTIFCQNGHKIFETKYSLPQQLSTEVKLPFESTWWAKYIAGVTGRNQRLYLSGAQHALGEVLIDNLSAVQEIWATPDSRRYTNNSSVDDAPSNVVTAILLWKFKQIQSEEPGTTTWRKVYCLSEGSKIKVAEDFLSAPNLEISDVRPMPTPIHRSGWQGEGNRSGQYSSENRGISPSAPRSHLTHMVNPAPTNESSILQHPSSSEAATDSGYASTITNRTEFRSEHPSESKCIAHVKGSPALIDAPTLPLSDGTIIQCDTNEAGDAESIYSDNSSASNVTQGYMDELANDLVHVVEPYKENGDVLQQVFEALPELLRAFALTLGHSSSSRTQRDMMVFIHRHRV